MGWYLVGEDQTGEKPYDFATPITSDITLEAGWLYVGDIETGDQKDLTEVQEKIWVAGIKDVTYNGGKQTFDLRVYDGNKMLTLGKDYTVSYKNNQNVYTVDKDDEQNFKPAKAPQVVIKMKGNYKGTHTVYFKINPADIRSGEFAAAEILVTNTGNVQTAKPVLTFNGKALKLGKDYVVTVKDNKVLKEAGDYTLILTGKGNFAETREVNYTITEDVKMITMDKVSVSGVKAQNYTGSEITLTGVKVKYKGKEIPAAEYTMTYENNQNVGTASLILTGMETDGNKDDIRFTGTKVVTFKINGSDMKKAVVTGINKSYDYAYGAEINPEYSVSLGGTPLTKDTHYKVKIDNNKVKGTATVTFTGKPDAGYTGSKVVKFKINAKSLTDAEVTLAEEGSVAIMKGGSTPKVEVKSGGVTLTEGVDYTVSYQNNKKAATTKDKKVPTVVVTGKGNYTGKNSTCKFDIVKKALTNENGIVVEVKDRETAGKAGDWKQSFKVYDADGKALSNKTDYNKTATYWVENEDGDMVEATDSNVKVGDVIEVRVTGLGSYGVKVEGQEAYAAGTYRLIKKGYDISKATIKIKEQYYTGSDIEITDNSQFEKVFLKVNGKPMTLELGKHIKVVEESYEKNDVKGTAKVTFAGIESGEGDDKLILGGTKTVTFKIKERDAATNWWDDLTASLQSLFEF